MSRCHESNPSWSRDSVSAAHAHGGDGLAEPRSSPPAEKIKVTEDDKACLTLFLEQLNFEGNPSERERERE